MSDAYCGPCTLIGIGDVSTFHPNVSGSTAVSPTTYYNFTAYGLVSGTLAVSGKTAPGCIAVSTYNITLPTPFIATVPATQSPGFTQSVGSSFINYASPTWCSLASDGSDFIIPPTPGSTIYLGDPFANYTHKSSASSNRQAFGAVLGVDILISLSVMLVAVTAGAAMIL